jgi:hypothetical protein
MPTGHLAGDVVALQLGPDLGLSATVSSTLSLRYDGAAPDTSPGLLKQAASVPAFVWVLVQGSGVARFGLEAGAQSIQASGQAHSGLSAYPTDSAGKWR